jgi:hypothetical protein
MSTFAAKAHGNCWCQTTLHLRQAASSSFAVGNWVGTATGRTRVRSVASVGHTPGMIGRDTGAIT